MKTLIIYDEEGYVLQQRQGEPEPRTPVGVPYLLVEIPENKRVKTVDGIGVDVSVTPHEVILEGVPPTEIDELSERLADLAEIVLMGGM